MILRTAVASALCGVKQQTWCEVFHISARVEDNWMVMALPKCQLQSKRTNQIISQFEQGTYRLRYSEQAD